MNRNSNSASVPNREDPAEILRKYDITGIFARYLNNLQGFKIVLICDDSTSMRETLLKGQTKWDELKMNVQVVLEISNAFSAECDVLFLNRLGSRNVKSIDELSEQFSKPPYGKV